MDFSLLIEGLRQARCITPLEKDILDTWNELQKSPFDRSSAQLQIVQNQCTTTRIFLSQSRRCQQRLFVLLTR